MTLIYQTTISIPQVPAPLARFYTITSEEIAMILSIPISVLAGRSFEANNLAEAIRGVTSNIDNVPPGNPGTLDYGDLIVNIERIEDTRITRPALFTIPEDATPEELDTIRVAAEEWARGNHEIAAMLAHNNRATIREPKPASEQALEAAAPLLNKAGIKLTPSPGAYDEPV